MKKPIISASILSADFAALGQDTRDAIEAGVARIHFDVMDHHFVPNLSFGTIPCSALRKAGITAPIDVHLMVDNPEPYIRPFAEAGATLITFHPETVSDVEATLSEIRACGLQAGLTFNPERPIHLSHAVIEKLDLILIMSVNPGFGGQAFIESSFEKIRAARAQLTQANSDPWLGVDGGIKLENLAEIVQAGANYLVMGSGLFHADDYVAHMRRIQAILQA